MQLLRLAEVASIRPVQWIVSPGSGESARSTIRLTLAPGSGAAEMAGFHAVRVTEPALKKVTAKLESAKLAADGTGTLPVAADETYDKLAKLIGTPAELETPAKAPAAPSTAKPPAPSSDAAKPAVDPWEAIDVGSVVLCYDPGDQAWYEAIVLALGADKQSLTLRWRDYPGEPRLTALRDKVGLTRPRAS